MVASSEFFHYDGLGSTVNLTDESEVVQESYTYDAFGNRLTTNTLTPPFLYVGQVGYYSDQETNDIYVRARIYAPKLMRWHSRDPIGLGGGMNTYEYAASTPTHSIDPSGLLTIEPVSADLSRSCGNYRVQFRFRLSDQYLVLPPNENVATGLKGYLVQKVSVWETKRDCPQQAGPLQVGLIPNSDPDEKWWEVWRVVADNSAAATDVSAYPGGGIGTYGYYRAYGEVRFYLKEDVGGLGVGIGDLDTDPDWGLGRGRAGPNQLSTTTPPNWWTDIEPVEGPGFRLAGVDWSCCCADASKNWSETVLPSCMAAGASLIDWNFTSPPS